VNRFFRISADAAYEQTRLGLDAAWGHEPPMTCVDPAAVAPRDTQGRILLGVRAEFCEYSVVVDLLPQLLASGVVEEIDEATYWASQPQSPF
jgi:hypothetical protein